MSSTQLLLETIVVAVFAGIASQVIAERIQMPSIVVLMIMGILLGPEFVGLVHPEYMGSGLEVLVKLAVALILFEGGLSLDLKAFKAVDQSIRNIVTLGMLITIVGGAIFCKYFIPELPLSLCFLYGALMSITGLTVINPILQRVRIKKEIATILKGEGILSNSLGAFAAVAVLEFILSSQASFSAFATDFFSKLLVGSILGMSMGYIIGKFLQKKYISDDLKNLVLLAWVITTFFISDMITSNSGILAVVFVGVAVQRENLPQLKTLKRFGGQISILFISILFILLSANLDLSNMVKLGWPGIFTVLGVMFVLRPLEIFLTNFNLLKFKEMIFVSWIGPKGIVSASVASLFSLILTKNGMPEAEIIESLAYLTIMVTVIFQGLTAQPVAAFCDVLMKTGGIAIIGANALGRTLGKAFSELGREVILIDNNIDNCKDAAVDDLETVFGNCLDPAVMEAANITNMDTVIATTANSEVNFLVCQVAKDEHHVSNVYPAIDAPDKGVHQRLVDEIGGNLAYAKTVSIEDWKLAVSKNQVKIIEWEMIDTKGGMLCDLEAVGIEQDNWLPLILKREQEYFFVHSDLLWQKGDVLICLSKEHMK